MVYSPHVYPAEVSDVPKDYGPNWITRMNTLWGFLIKENIAPVFVGECGDWLATPDAQAWAEAFVNSTAGSIAQPNEGWIAADPFRGGVRVPITGPQGFERTVVFGLDEAPATITERVRETPGDWRRRPVEPT